MTDETRDPRVDPKPGDVVMFGPQWQIETYSVIGCNKRTVQYQMGPMRAVLLCSLDEWRKWSRGGEVLKRAATLEASKSLAGEDI